MLPAEYLLARTGDAPALPVAVADCKADLRITHTDDDTYIEGLIEAAAAYVGGRDGVTGKLLTTQSWVYSLAGSDCNGRIYLPLTPVQSITSIAYVDTAGSTQAATVADFRLFGTEDWAYLEPKQGKAWPTTACQLDAIRITFVGGFGATSAVPANIARAIRLIVAHWYANREAVVTGTIATEVPLAAASLLAISRKGWMA